MKKSLLAVAAIGAFASAAQAQSSVTVYGILDMGYIGGNSRVSTNAVQTNGGQVKSTANAFSNSAESTSRLGFKGTEDLGGGMSAFFTAEFQLYPQDGDLSGNSNGGLLNRQTFVGLKKNGIGSTALGTQYTPTFNTVTATSASGANNIIGDLVYAGGSPIQSTKEFNNAGAQTVSMTNRVSNALTLQSDSFAGFRANALWTLANTNTSAIANSSGQITSGGNSNASGWGLGADYTYNKFFVSVGYQSLKQLTSATNNGTTLVTGLSAVPAAWASAQPSNASIAGSAVNIQDNQFAAGASYDFGILKAYAQFVNRKATATATSNWYVKRSAEQIGVRSFITPKIEAWAQGGLGRYTAAGANSPTVNMNSWQLGSNYYLSKRTNLYAIYGQQINSTGAIGSVSGSSSASQYALGVRHTF